jgi:excisionase family DNA binding protein
MRIFEYDGGGMETYLTIAELAEYIKLSEQTVRRYVLNRTVPYHKIQKAVRFRVSEIEEWIDGGGLDGTVRAGPEDGRQGDLFEEPKAEDGWAAEVRCPPAADSLGVCEANSRVGEIAGNEGDNTGGAA